MKTDIVKIFLVWLGLLLYGMSLQANTITITENQKLLASNGSAYDGFGSSMLFNENTLLVGSGAGLTYVFTKDSNGFFSDERILTPLENGYSYGTLSSVALSGNTIIVGSPLSDTYVGPITGMVYVFEVNANGVYTEKNRLIPQDGLYPADHYGISVSISGNIVAIGSELDDDNGENSGSVYIFERDVSGNFVEIAKLTALDGVANDWFGHSVLIDGDMVLVSAPNDDGNGAIRSGSVYIFKRSATGEFVQTGKLYDVSAHAYDTFGASMAIDGDTLVIGAEGTVRYHSGAFYYGSIYVFERNSSGEFVQTEKLYASDVTYSNQGFGSSVSISGDVLVVGAPGASNSGAAYVFKRDGSGNFVETRKLIASDGESYDRFGSSVAVSDVTVTVGADHDDNKKGSAYIFDLNASSLNPDINLSTTSLSFSDMVVLMDPFTESATESFTITNDGDAELTIDSIVLSGSNYFTYSNNCSQPLMAGDSCTVSVTFTPETTGVFSGTLAIASNDPDEGSISVPLSGKGVTPQMSLLTPTLNFGDVIVGQSTTQTASILNVGAIPWKVGQMQVYGSSAFVQSSTTCGIWVNPGDQCDVTVTYTPQSVGASSASLYIIAARPYVDNQAQMIVSLAGNGLVPIEPDISLSTNNITYGDLLVGTSTSESITITNDGNADLHISNMIVSGNNSFSVSGCTQAILPGTSCSATVTFTPVVTGVVSATLTIVSDDPDEGSMTVGLTGKGIAPDITLSATSLAFGDLLVGEQSQQTVTVTNDGDAVLTIDSITLAGSVYSAAGCTQPLGAGDSCDVTVTFSPATAGAVSDTLTITSDDPDEATVTVNLTGNGIAPDITLSTTNLAFGDLLIGETATQSVTISNDGDAVLNIGSIALSGSGDFTYNGCTQSLAAGDSCDVTVTFSPVTAGVATDTLTIMSDDPDEATVTVALSGNGITAETYLQELIAYANQEASAGNLIGVGPGKSGAKNVRKFIKRLEKALKALQKGNKKGHTKKVCHELEKAYKYIDGENKPKDIVAGSSAQEISERILLLINHLCG